MIVIEIPIRSYPKPAGAQGYGGKITMMGSRGGKYGRWTVAAKKAIKDFYLERSQSLPQGVKAYGLVFHHYCSDRRAGDVLNLAGSITDILVKLGILIDDSPRYMPRVAAGIYFERYAMVDNVRVIVPITQPAIKIIVCETKEDWQRAASFL